MNAMRQPASRTAPGAALNGHLEEGVTIDVVSIGVGSAVGVSIFSLDGTSGEGSWHGDATGARAGRGSDVATARRSYCLVNRSAHALP